MKRTPKTLIQRRRKSYLPKKFKGSANNFIVNKDFYNPQKTQGHELYFPNVYTTVLHVWISVINEL